MTGPRREMVNLASFPCRYYENIYLLTDYRPVPGHLYSSIRSLNLTVHPHLFPSLRTSGFAPSQPYNSMACTGIILPLKCVTIFGVWRAALFWVNMQQVVVIFYRRFGTTYRNQIQGSGNKILYPWRWDPIGCPETLVRYYHHSLRINSE